MIHCKMNCVSITNKVMRIAFTYNFPIFQFSNFPILQFYNLKNKHACVLLSVVLHQFIPLILNGRMVGVRIVKSLSYVTRKIAKPVEAFLYAFLVSWLYLEKKIQNQKMMHTVYALTEAMSLDY